jgi:hypothetical protein
MLFVNNRDEIIFDRKVQFTPAQIRTFKGYKKDLDKYRGKQISKTHYVALLQEYLNVVSVDKLRREFLALFR